MKQAVRWLRHSARLLGLCLLAVAPALAPLPALAQTTDGPNGINIGFQFNWYNDGSLAVPTPQGFSATFIENDGQSLATCLGGTVSPTTVACDFIMTYSVGGTPQTPVPVTDGSYETVPNPAPSFPSQVCDIQHSPPTAPLTLWDCFNVNSYGQVFYAQSTGPLTSISISLTCLNPAGGTLGAGLYALIYQVNPGGESLPSKPLAQVPVDLSTCPTASTWAGKTFTGSDFALVPLNFQNVNLTSGTPYGIFFAGPLAPGTPPAGFKPPAPVPTFPVWGEVAFVVGLLAAGLWMLRRRRAA